MAKRSDVKPLTYLNNRTADLVRQVEQSGRAVTITQSGEAQDVVMDVDVYDRWRSALALLNLAAQSEAEAPNRFVKQSDAFRRAEAMLARRRARA